jgi:iron complex outermembrane receptor protein
MLSDFCNTLIAPPAFTAAQRAACNASPNKANATVLNFEQNATNYAVYAQANFKLIDNLTLVAGGRYTKDEKSGTFDQQVFNAFAAAIPLRAKEFAKLDKDDDQVTWRFGLNWTPTDDLLFYGSYSTGYKSGGFNSGGGQVNLTAPPPAGPGPDGRVFDKETSDDYEIGAKTTLAGGAAHFNVNLFRMDLNDFQDRAFNGASFNVINAGNLRQQGVEAEADTIVIEGLRIFGALGYLDSEFTEYDNASCLPTAAQLNPQCTQNLKGVANVFSPKWTISAGAEMRGDFDFADMGYLFRFDMNYVDEQNINGIIDNNPQGFEPSYALLSARYALQFGADRRYTVAFFGENLTDEGFCRGRFYQPFNTNLGLNQPLAVGGGTVTRCIVNQPRTLGVQFKVNFF